MASRTDAEYILMGKIMEKHHDIISLTKQLKELEEGRGLVPVDLDVVEEASVAAEVVEEVEVIHVEDKVDVIGNVEYSPPLTAITLSGEEVPRLEMTPVKKSNFQRKNIPVEKKLQLVANDAVLAAGISSGNNINVRWGTKSSVPAWSNGRKYDPTTGKIYRIRTELRKYNMSMRDLSGHTGYALDTLKDIIREMDKQGFFTNT